MNTITVNAQILAGNLGDGWNDNHQAAQALADYTRTVWTADLAGYNVEINIDVQSGEGSARRLSVVAPSDDLVQQIEDALTDEGAIWERFYTSPQAAAYFAA